MPAVSTQQLINLQSQQKNIRNICIVAHVDHGKTTLSDGLLASNGIISSKISGKARYLDSREDEQQRDKTSSEKITKSEDYLINLIDSPGHVDFSSEVSSASRLCDGALVLVDAVEGTHSVLRQAWIESVRPILVFNKIDRLIMELKLTTQEAYLHMNRILEQVNAVMGTFFSENVMETDARKHEEKKQSGEEIDGENWHLEIDDDSSIYFSPERGNVIFTSAIDGWAFRIDQFAQIYAAKLGVKEEMLKKVLWGDFYLDPKTKRVIGRKGLKGRVLKPLFVQFVLDNLWAVYDAVSNDRDKVEKIVKALNIKVLPRDLKSKDPKILLQAVLSQWLPLSSSILLAVIDQLPSPKESQSLRLPKILYPGVEKLPDANMLSETRAKLEKAVYECDASESAPVVLYVSKMFSVPNKMVVSDTVGRVPLTAEEIRIRKQERMIQQQKLKDNPELEQLTKATTSQPPEVDPNAEKMVGFARIYSGTIKVGDTVNILGPKYNPAHPELHRHEIKIESLYLMMGRELHELKEVPAGNVFGIGGLEKYIHKTGTISSVLDCPSFAGLRLATSTILRVALEPADLSQMSQLVEGLRILNQADPSVEVLRQETGEHVIITSGELHLERCLKDLKELYAKIDIKASDPIVSFRETISSSPAMVLQNTAQSQLKVEEDPSEEQITLPPHTVMLLTSNKMCKIRVRVSKLSETVTNYLQNNTNTIKLIADDKESDGIDSAHKKVEVQSFLNGLQKAFTDTDKPTKEWDNITQNVWAYGPKRTGPNLLVNRIQGYTESKIQEYESSIIAGFQLATQSGPLCGEPIMGCCFFVENVEISDVNADALKRSLLPGQIITTMREACKQVFLTWSPRLMLAMYSCDLQAP
ncbi:Elongation factor-like GTPase 1, partial [Nowakowskiella sp. JEL0078]